MKNKIILNIEEINSYEGLKVYDFTSNNYKYVYKEILNNLLDSEININKFISFLENNELDIIDIYLNNNNLLLSINKIALLNTLLDYMTNETIINKDIIRKICNIAIKLDYSNINIKDKLSILVDKELVNIPVSYFYEFLLLEDNYYNLFVSKKEKYYKGIEIEKFIYSMDYYFNKNKYFSNYIFPSNIINRFLELKTLQVIDYESINKLNETTDPYLKDVVVSNELENELFNNSYFDKLECILKTYIKLCNMFTYDDLYYIDPISVEGMKHTKINYLKEIGINNNKIVCFEFTAIFGYFLNKLGINYEVIQDKAEYGFLHNYIIFRYDKYLIKVEPIESVLKNDLTTVKIKSNLVGIYSINQNHSTREEFFNILNKYYKTEKIEYENEYLPANKINYNNISFSNKIKEYIIKIDLIVKIINKKELEIIEKITYFKALMKLIFSNQDLQTNIFDCIVVKNSNPKSLVIIIALNEISYMNLDNYYLLYDNDLTFIEKDELQEQFNNNYYEYLNEKELPGIKSRLR